MKFKKIKYNSFFFCLLALVLVFSGCKRSRMATAIRPSKNMIELIENIEKTQTEYRWLRSRGRVNVESPGQNMTAAANFKIRQDSLIWGSVSLLIELARAQITNDSATILHRTSREYESYPVEQMQRLLAIQGLDLKALQRILVAYPPFGLSESYTFRQPEANSNYQLSRMAPGFVENIEMDPQTLRMKRYEFKKNENQRISIYYDNFEKVENMLLPKKIVFELMAPEKNTLTFEITNYQLLDSDEVNFTIPENYKKIH